MSVMCIFSCKCKLKMHFSCRRPPWLSGGELPGFPHQCQERCQVPSGHRKKLFTHTKNYSDQVQSSLTGTPCKPATSQINNLPLITFSPVVSGLIHPYPNLVLLILLLRWYLCSITDMVTLVLLALKDLLPKRPPKLSFRYLWSLAIGPFNGLWSPGILRALSVTFFNFCHWYQWLPKFFVIPRDFPWPVQLA